MSSRKNRDPPSIRYNRYMAGGCVINDVLPRCYLSSGREITECGPRNSGVVRARDCSLSQRRPRSRHEAHIFLAALELTSADAKFFRRSTRCYVRIEERPNG
jgi:hypothetical protein